MCVCLHFDRTSRHTHTHTHTQQQQSLQTHKVIDAWGKLCDPSLSLNLLLEEQFQDKKRVIVDLTHQWTRILSPGYTVLKNRLFSWVTPPSTERSHRFVLDDDEHNAPLFDWVRRHRGGRPLVGFWHLLWVRPVVSRCVARWTRLTVPSTSTHMSLSFLLGLTCLINSYILYISIDI